jgi:hypothetical protein
MATPTPTPTATPSPSLPPEPAATEAPSALGDLAGFVDAARAADARLHEAAALVNASIRSDVIAIDARTAAAVKATDPSAVAAAIPAGMPAKLLGPVLTVYSDLVSRSAAMGPFASAGTYSRTATDADLGASDAERQLRCLANGSPAAGRFTADLAAVGTVARATPPLKRADPTSLASAELAVHLMEIRLRNTGCASCGGYVMTRMSSIVWDDAAPKALTRTGSIRSDAYADGGGVRFTASYEAGKGWVVLIYAC